MASRHSEMTKALSSRHLSTKGSVFRALGKRLNWLYTREIVSQALVVSFMTGVMVMLAFPTPAHSSLGIGTTARHKDGLDRVISRTWVGSS